MKKVLLILGVSFALTTAANASIISATCLTNPTTFAGGNGGPTAVTCQSFNSLGTGGILVSGALQGFADMVLDSSFGSSVPADQAVVTFAGDQGFVSGTVTVANQAGTFSKTYSPVNPYSNTSNTINGALAVIVNVSSSGTGAALTDANGSSNGSVFLTYTYNAATGSTPEPATMSMLGLGLLGLGAFGRRFRK